MNEDPSNIDNETVYSYPESSRSQYFSITLPSFHKSRVQLWKYLNQNNLDSLLACFDIDDYDEFISQLNPREQKLINSFSELNFTNSSFDRSDQFKVFSRLLSIILNLNLNEKKDRILIERYYYLIKFGLANTFGKEQISALIILTKQTHDVAIETSFGNLDETFDYFKRLLLCYSVHRPPHSLKIFTPKQCEIIIDYVLKSYFNQFKLYKLIYTPALRLSLKFNYMNLPQESNLDGVEKAILDLNVDQETRAVSKLENAEDDKTTDELKEFIKFYLNERLEKMKSDLTGDSSSSRNESANDKNKKGAKQSNQKSGKR